MGEVTLSLSEEVEEKLRELARKDERSLSKEVEHLIEVHTSTTIPPMTKEKVETLKEKLKKLESATKKRRKKNKD